MARRSKGRSKWLIGGGTAVVVAILAVVYIVFVRTSAVAGSVTNVITQKPVAGVTLTLGKHKAASDTDGKYQIEGVHLLQKKKEMTIAQPADYEKHQPVKVDYGKKRTANDVQLTPNLVATAKYGAELRKNNQYDLFWDLLSADDKAYWGSKEQYIALFSGALKAFQNVCGGGRTFEIGATTRKLDTWTSPVTAKAYKDVWEVPETVNATCLGIPISDSKPSYYQLTDGYWHAFSNTKREEVEQSTKDLQQYSQ